MLSDYCKRIRDKFHISIGQVHKLIPTLNKKRKIPTTLSKFTIVS